MQHPAEGTVVEYHRHDRNPFLDRGQEPVHRDAKTPIAADRDDRALRMRSWWS
jgi:hypothetical protein